jgi:hypothetical protein
MQCLIEVDSFQNTYFSLSSIKKEYWLGIEKLNTDDMTWEKVFEDAEILAMKSFN